jgi:hypothetical protein
MIYIGFLKSMFKMTRLEQRSSSAWPRPTKDGSSRQWSDQTAQLYQIVATF